MNIKGKAWRFGDGITTDDVCPGRYFHLKSNLPEFAKHCLEEIRPEFPLNVKAGDVLVAGENFGLGSSREQAPIVIKLTGIGAVLAKSFARIFFRNAVNSGLPALILDTDQIKDGDELEIDLVAGTVKNLTTGQAMTAQSLPPVMRAIIGDGGLVEHIKKHGRLKVE
ncbi:MAG: 3-isopropylmalate dehydratase small subunit [Thermodesulfobacteriota bacterium]|nr:3-isopropylmalate dehydratase small subunit [Thermodesulfobacteriota bacterium]